MKNKREKRVRKILDEFLKGKLSPRVNELVRGWMLDESDHSLKEKVDLELFDKHIKPSLIPDKNTRKSLQQMHERLGFPERIRRKQYSVLRPALAVAAVIAVVFVVGTIVWNSGDMTAINNNIATVTIEPQPHTQQDISLPDGSEIELSAGAKLSYNEDFENDRIVYLDGEAYFRVEKKDGQTFRVKTNTITVTVLGTEFHMRAESGAETSEITLTTGKVEVAAEGIDNVTLTPGQHLTYNKEFQTVVLSEIGEAKLAAMRGMSISFSEAITLDDVFHTISVFYNKRLEVMDESIDVSRKMVVPFNGTETIEEVMSMLKMITGDLFDYTIQADTIKITKPE